jgi:hypothetical protein
MKATTLTLYGNGKPIMIHGAGPYLVYELWAESKGEEGRPYFQTLVGLN